MLQTVNVAIGVGSAGGFPREALAGVGAAPAVTRVSRLWPFPRAAGAGSGVSEAEEAALSVRASPFRPLLDFARGPLVRSAFFFFDADIPRIWPTPYFRLGVRVNTNGLNWGIPFLTIGHASRGTFRHHAHRALRCSSR